jgi:hypothetical protein
MTRRTDGRFEELHQRSWSAQACRDSNIFIDSCRNSNIFRRLGGVHQPQQFVQNQYICSKHNSC